MNSNYGIKHLNVSSIVFAATATLMLLGCSTNDTKENMGLNMTPEVVKIDISSDYFKKRNNWDKDGISYVILQENANGMISDIDKVMEYDNRFYILDQFGARSVVSFSECGEPLAKFGRIGNGEGEYLMPHDMWVDDEGVYVLDASHRKLLQFDHAGGLISQKQLPFTADALARLANGNFLFSLLPDGSDSFQLCITDGEIGSIKNFLPYDEGFKGGYHTNKIFQSLGDKIKYYRSPLDYIVLIDSVGNIRKIQQIDFGERSLPAPAKLDYLAFKTDNDTEDYLWMADSPIEVDDTTWIALVENGYKQYTIIANPKTGESGGMTYGDASSVYTPIIPLGVDNHQNIISLLISDFERDCDDYETLPDSIRMALNEGMQVLAIQPLKK